MVPATGWPKVNIVTLNWNTKDETLECVRSLQKIDYPDFGIIVVDNGSTDGSPDLFRESLEDSVILVENADNLGYSKGFNTGIQRAMDMGAEYVLIINSDTIVDPQVLKELVIVAETDKTIGFVTGKVFYADFNGRKDILQTVAKKPDRYRLVGGQIGANEEDSGQYDDLSELDFCDDVFMLARRDVIEKTGGYDPNFFLQGEQADWQLRAKKLGYRIFFAPGAKIWHKVSVSSGGAESPMRHYFTSRNNILVVYRNGTSSQFRRFILHRIFREFPLRSLSFLRRGRPDLIKARLKGNLSGIVWVLSQEMH